jgi:hypothetical protein
MGEHNVRIIRGAHTADHVADAYLATYREAIAARRRLGGCDAPR